MRFVISFAILALVASVTVPRYASQIHGGGVGPSLMAAHPVTPAAAASSNSRSVVIPPGRNGHFQVEGRIDGRRLDFMVDTGASVIALTERTASSLGIHPAQRDYTAVVKTANGVVRAAPVELNMVQI